MSNLQAKKARKRAEAVARHAEQDKAFIAGDEELFHATHGRHVNKREEDKEEKQLSDFQRIDKLAQKNRGVGYEDLTETKSEG